MLTSTATPGEYAESPAENDARVEAAASRAEAKLARDEAVRAQREAKMAQGAAHDAVQTARFSLTSLSYRRGQLARAAAATEPERAAQAAQLRQLEEEATRLLLDTEPLLRRASFARQRAVGLSERFLEMARAANRSSHEAGLPLPFQVAKNVRDLFDIRALAGRGHAYCKEMVELARRQPPSQPLARLISALEGLAAEEAACVAKDAQAAIDAAS